METQKKQKKTENIKEYMNNYLKQRYANDPVYGRMLKNTANIKKKYNIPDETKTKYKHGLHHIIKMKEMIEELPDGMFETFLMEYKTLKIIKNV